MRHGALTLSMRLCGPLRKHVVSPITGWSMFGDALCVAWVHLLIGRYWLSPGRAGFCRKGKPLKKCFCSKSLLFCLGYDEERAMGTASPAVVDVFRCIDSIKVIRLWRDERSLPTAG